MPADFVSDFRLVITVKSGEIFLDNIVIKEVAEASLVSDGNMEAPNLEAWRNYGVPAIKEKIINNGSQVLRVVAGNVGVQQGSIPVVAGKNYELSFDAKILSGAIHPRLGIRTSNSDFQGKIEILTTVAYVNWKKYTRRFTMPADFVSDFRLVLPADGEFYLDNVLIKELAEALIITDGNMESPDVDAWKNYGLPIAKEKATFEKFSGERRLYFNSTSTKAGFQQLNVPVIAGKTYQFTFKHKTVSGKLNVLLGINSSNGDFENKKAIL